VVEDALTAARRLTLWLLANTSSTYSLNANSGWLLRSWDVVLHFLVSAASHCEEGCSLAHLFSATQMSQLVSKVRSPTQLIPPISCSLTRIV
jgi:hypothetical protein